MRFFMIAIALAMTATAAHADHFDTIGPACIPDEGSLDRFYIDGATIRQAGTMTTSEASFYCPIPHVIDAPTQVVMMYSSSEKNLANPITYVKATYWKMHKSSTTRSAIATASSLNGICDNSKRTVSASFSDTYDPTQYVYYVKITMRRRNSTQGVGFWFVSVR